MLFDVIICIVHISGQYLTELIYPLSSFFPVCSYKRMHGKHIHGIIMAFAAACHNSVTKIGIIDHVITSNQTGQIECLAWRIQCDGPLLCVLAYRLGRCVVISFQNQIRPDLVGNNNTVVCLIDFHGLFDFFRLPDSSGRVVWITEHCDMDLVCLDFGIHIFIVHPPDSFFILL